MRSTYYEGSDTLVRDRLPSGTLNVSYRPPLPKSAGAITAAAVLAIVLLSILFTLAIRISGFLATSPVFTLFTALSLAGGIACFILGRQWLLALLVATSGLLLWLVLAFLHMNSSPGWLYLAGFGPVLLAAVWMADAMMAHFLRWKAADPRYRQGTGQQWEAVWRGRFTLPSYRSAIILVAASYGLGAVLLLAPTPSLAPQPLRSSLVVLTVTGLLTGSAAWTIVRHLSAKHAESRLLWPLVHWFSYRPHSFAAGVLRIPVFPFGCTSALSRQAITALLLFLITASVASTACYFPVTMAFVGNWDAFAEIPSDQIPKPPSLIETTRKMDQNAKRQMDRLPVEHQRKLVELMGQRQHIADLAAAQRKTFVDMMTYVNSKPEAWFPVVMRQSPKKPTFVMWTVLCSLALSGVCSTLVLISVMIVLARPVLVQAEEFLEPRGVYVTDWDGHVARMLDSTHTVERESLWLGTHTDANYPILLHRSVLTEHAHILGDSGSGKTSLALAPMAAQLIRMAGRDAHGAGTDKSPTSSVVIIDLKGDMSFLHGARIEAEEARLPFQWFTTSLHCSTFPFNPFLQRHFARLSVTQRTEIIADALSIQHGEGYGRSYYSRINRQVLSRFMRSLGDSITSFRDLYELKFRSDLLGKKLRLSPKEIEDAGEVFAMVEQLASHDALNENRPKYRKRQIDMYKVATKPRVVYFYLPSALGSASAREVGKLALYCLLSAAARRGDDNHQVYLLIDEFQQIVSENLELILRQARSMGIATILANQTISDLKTSFADLVHTVRANTRLKQYFASTDLRQQDDLMAASGETVDYIQHWNGNPFEPSQEIEVLRPRIDRNTVIRVSDDQNLSIMHLSRGKGFAQTAGFPFVARSEHHIPTPEYQARKAMPWPASVPGTLTPTAEWTHAPSAPCGEGRHAPNRNPQRKPSKHSPPSNRTLPASGSSAQPSLPPQPPGNSPHGTGIRRKDAHGEPTTVSANTVTTGDDCQPQFNSTPPSPPSQSGAAEAIRSDRIPEGQSVGERSHPPVSPPTTTEPNTISSRTEAECRQDDIQRAPIPEQPLQQTDSTSNTQIDSFQSRLEEMEAKRQQREQAQRELARKPKEKNDESSHE